MHHQSYWENINYTKYKEIKFEIFLNMENNTQNTTVRSCYIGIRSLHLSFVLL